jgi:hypothetical protein
MTETESIQMMAQRYLKAFDSGGEQAADTVMSEIFNRHGREVVQAVFDEADRQKEFEWQEVKAQHARERQRIENAKHIFEGLPETVSFYEACQIKAARGDALAHQYLDYFNSREHRLETALTDAAVELHPGWHMEGKVMHKDDDAPDVLHGELVEWLYKNHPDVAKRIERAPACRPG